MRMVKNIRKKLYVCRDEERKMKVNSSPFSPTNLMSSGSSTTLPWIFIEL